MAAENAGVSRVATSVVSSGASRSTNASADSYIGSLISLTSKSEIRYEGILYNINTEESSIGLKNVRSFGTEGRKKDGQQISPSDKVYEYILFRGSDIKDLQVKSSSPPPPPPLSTPIDPAIIQHSQYPRPVTAPSPLPSVGNINPLSEIGSQNPQVGMVGSNFQGNLPLYQPGGTLATWGAPPLPLPSSTANESGIAMPMYWPNYYGPPNGIPHFNQQPLLRPPPGLSVAPTLQQTMPYPNFNTLLPTAASNLSVPKAVTTIGDFALPVVPPTSVPINLLPSSSSPAIPPSVAAESLPGMIPSNGAIPSVPSANLDSTTPVMPSLTTSDGNPCILASIKPDSSSTTAVTYKTSGLIPSSLTPEMSNNSQVPSTTLAVPPPVQAVHTDVEVVQVSSSLQQENRPPILPLPSSRPTIRPNGGQFHPRHSYRGRGERGRGTGRSVEVSRFTEDFDFEAMNEKFNKDEVWGSIGKTYNGDGPVNENDPQEYGDEIGKDSTKPVYNKDDFFDKLSCNTLDISSLSGRTKFSEQMKLDTETFGEFSRYWGGRGGRGPPRGGRRPRGSFYGRGYEYNYRGRGRGDHSRAF